MFFSRFNAQRIVSSIDFFLPDFSCKKLFPSIPAFSICFRTNIVIEFQTIASVGINLCRINIGKINWHKQRAYIRTIVLILLFDLNKSIQEFKRRSQRFYFLCIFFTRSCIKGYVMHSIAIFWIKSTKIKERNKDITNCILKIRFDSQTFLVFQTIHARGNDILKKGFRWICRIINLQIQYYASVEMMKYCKFFS